MVQAQTQTFVISKLGNVVVKQIMVNASVINVPMDFITIQIVTVRNIDFIVSITNDDILTKTQDNDDDNMYLIQLAVAMDRDQNLKPVTKTPDNVYVGTGSMDQMVTESADAIGN